MKVTTFWILSATTLFCLSLIYLHHGYHRRNLLFACWLCFAVCMQLLAAWGLAMGGAAWLRPVGIVADLVSYTLGVGVLLVALMRRNCPVNRTLLAGLGAMVVFSLVSRWVGDSVDAVARTWMRNIAFFGRPSSCLSCLPVCGLTACLLWRTQDYVGPGLEPMVKLA